MDLSGDADIALYSGPGIDDIFNAMHSFFHRPTGWSTMGTGGEASLRVLQKGPIVRAFLDPIFDTNGISQEMIAHIIAQSFVGRRADGRLYLPDFPNVPGELEQTAGSDLMRVYKSGNVTVYAQVGNELLFEAARDRMLSGNAVLSARSVGDNAFVYHGTYAQTNREFAWIGFREGNESAFIRIDIVRMDSGAPDAADHAIMDVVQCGVSFHGRRLNCG